MVNMICVSFYVILVLILIYKKNVILVLIYSKFFLFHFYPQKYDSVMYNFNQKCLPSQSGIFKHFYGSFFIFGRYILFEIYLLAYFVFVFFQ
jgi:hypothetical protein